MSIQKVKLLIGQMHCTSCANQIEQKLKKTKGIKQAAVNFATQKGHVEYDSNLIDENKIIEIIKQMGYDAIKQNDIEQAIEQENKLKENEIKQLERLLIICFVFAFPVFLISMPMQWLGIEVPYKNFILFLFASIVQIFGGARFYKSAFAALKDKTANMDSLIALGTTAAYIHSILVLVYPNEFGYETYFETSSLIIFFVLLGKYIELKMKNKASETIKNLLKLQTKTVIVEVNKKEKRLPLDEIKVGDIIIIKPGQRIPVDGVVVFGHSYVDQSAMTGESMPVKKSKGDHVIGGTLNKTGYLKIKAQAIGKDTLLGQIIDLIEQAQQNKPPIQRFADEVSKYFIPIVMLIAFASFFYWYVIALKSFAFALSMFIAVLVIACPCALGLATPTAIMVASAKGAQEGILIKDPVVLELAHKINTIVFDKTATLTYGKPKVNQIISLSSLTEKEILLYAASLEKKSSHPIASAILEEARHLKLKLLQIKDFKEIAGKGIVGKFKNSLIVFGNKSLLKLYSVNIKEYDQKIKDFENLKTTVFLAINKKIVGLIAISDKIRKSAKEAIEQLQKNKKEVIMLTGDNESTAFEIAKQLKIKKYVANLLPDQKEKEIRKLKQQNKIVAMVGDGINDAAALQRSDIAITIGSGTDIAFESAQIILLKNDLRDVVKAIKLSEYTFKKIKQNLFWAFIYNVSLIAIAAGVFYPSLTISPILAAAAMSLSSISVVTNSLTIKNYKF